ncbi:MAG: MBL fold metallo-hydrolase, partial [Armatimonadota bacterium]
MIFKVLGTSAAEAWPALFCVCDACDRARFRGGKDLRTRTSYMLGEAIQVDFPPDSVAHAIHYGLDTTALRHVFITHSHQDHLFPDDLEFRRQGFSVLEPDTVLNVHGNETVVNFLNERLRDPSELALRYHVLRPFKPVTVEGEVTFLPIPATHATPPERPLNFIIRAAGKTILIGHDTGWYADDTWDFLGERVFSLIFLDCTYGPSQGRLGHMGVPAVIEARQEL